MFTIEKSFGNPIRFAISLGDKYLKFCSCCFEIVVVVVEFSIGVFDIFKNEPVPSTYLP